MTSPSKAPRPGGTQRFERIKAKPQHSAVQQIDSDGQSTDIEDNASASTSVTKANKAIAPSQSRLDIDNMMETLRQLLQDFENPPVDDADKDENLTCPVHLTRPSMCPVQSIEDCPEPTRGPLLSKPELLQAQAFDDDIVPRKAQIKLLDALKQIQESPDLETVRTFLLPILHERVWRLVVITWGLNDVTTFYHEPEINGRVISMDFAPMIREAIRATFRSIRRKRGHNFRWDRLFAQPLKLKCKATTRTSKSGSQIIESLASWFSQELKLPKSSRAADTGMTWGARSQELETSRLAEESSSEEAISDQEVSERKASHEGQPNDDKASHGAKESSTESVTEILAGSSADDEEAEESGGSAQIKERRRLKLTKSPGSSESDLNSDHADSADETSLYTDLAPSFDESSSDDDDDDDFVDLASDEADTEWKKDDQDLLQEQGDLTIQMLEELDKGHSGSSSVDEDPHERARRFLGAEFLKERQLTPAQCEEILNRCGPKPSLEGLSKQAREELQRCTATFRQRLDDTLQRMSKYACGSPRRVNDNQYDPRLRPWHISNGLPETRGLILDLLTDPRITPYQSQIARGCSTCNADEYRRAGRLQPDNDFADCGDLWGIYNIDVLIPRQSTNGTASKGDCIFRYTGSSTGGRGLNGIVGMRSRIVNGHEAMIHRLQHADCERTKEFRQYGKALFIHEVAAYPDAKTSYHKTMTFPIIQEESLLHQQVKQLVLYSELAIMSLDDTFDERALRRNASRLSLAVARSLRTASAPRAPWLGTNRALPTSNGQSVFSRFVDDALLEILDRNFINKKKNWLEEEDFKFAQAEFSHRHPHVKSPLTRWHIRISFKTMLRCRGVKYVSLREKRILDLLPLFAAVKEHMTTRLAALEVSSGMPARPPEAWTYRALTEAFKERGLRRNWAEITSRLQSATKDSDCWRLNAEQTSRRWNQSLSGNYRVLLKDENWKQITFGLSYDGIQLTRAPGSQFIALPAPIRERVFQVIRWALYKTGVLAFGSALEYGSQILQREMYKRVTSVVISQLSLDRYANGSLLQRIQREPGICKIYILKRVGEEWRRLHREDPGWATPALLQLPHWEYQEESFEAFELSHFLELAKHRPTAHLDNDARNDSECDIANLLNILNEHHQVDCPTRLEDSDLSSTSANDKAPVNDVHEKRTIFRFYNGQQCHVSNGSTSENPSETAMGMALDQKLIDVEIARALVIKCIRELKTKRLRNHKDTFLTSDRDYCRLRKYVIERLVRSVPTMNSRKFDGFVCDALCGPLLHHGWERLKVVIKKAMAEIWQEKLLHVFFLVDQDSWAKKEMQHIMVLINKTTTFNFMEELYSRLVKKGLDKHLSTRHVLVGWIYVLLPGRP